jgi:hypothetical protein
MAKNSPADEGHLDLLRGSAGGADFRIPVVPLTPEVRHQAVERLVIQVSCPHRSDKIKTLRGEKAGEKPSIGRETRPRALAAKRSGD